MCFWQIDRARAGVLSVMIAALFFVWGQGAPEAGQQQPGFDCSKSRTSAEELICKDEELASLDRLMNTVFEEARALSQALPDQGADLRTLKATQRGWIKGRDECWTSSEGLRACIVSEYGWRIGKLTAQYNLGQSERPVFFMCNGNPAVEIVVTFFKPRVAGLQPSVRLEWGDQAVAGVLVSSASGSKYAASQGRSFWIKGHSATLEWPFGTVFKCSVRSN